MIDDGLLGTICEVLREFLEKFQDEHTPILAPDLRLSDLPEFDSLRCLEFEVFLSKHLDTELTHVVLPPEGGSSRTIAEIATEVQVLLGESEPQLAESL